MNQGHGVSAGELRREFDAAFARPAAAAVAAQTVELLFVSAGGAQLALRTSQIKAVQRCPALAQVPSAAEALEGVAAIRGVVVGVYSLARLAGRPAGAAPGAWLALCGDGTVGLVFDALGAHARLPAADIRTAHGAQDGIAEIGGVPHVVVDIAALLERITGAVLVQPKE